MGGAVGAQVNAKNIQEQADISKNKRAEALLCVCSWAQPSLRTLENRRAASSCGTQSQGAQCAVIFWGGLSKLCRNGFSFTTLASSASLKLSLLIMAPAPRAKRFSNPPALDYHYAP